MRFTGVRHSTFMPRERQPRGKEPGQPVTERWANFKNPSRAPSSASTIALGQKHYPQGKQESRALAGPCLWKPGVQPISRTANGQTRPAQICLPPGGGCRQKRVLRWPSLACIASRPLPAHRKSGGQDKPPGQAGAQGLYLSNRLNSPPLGKRQVPCVPWGMQAPENRALTSPTQPFLEHPSRGPDPSARTLADVGPFGGLGTSGRTL